MKRVMKLALALALVLAMASMALAQAPTPVLRMGDWVEIGDDTWMNIIGNITMDYITSHNPEFEDDIRDTPSTLPPTDLNRNGLVDIGDSNHFRRGDVFHAEVRFGADFRYKKSLTSQILLETDIVWDGNIIDRNLVPAETHGSTIHVERFWIRYKIPNTPITFHVGPDLTQVTLARMISDDDPRFAVWADFDGWQIGGQAFIQREGLRLNRANDNDDIYYNFWGEYTGLRPHRFRLDVLWYRDRFRHAIDGQKGDIVQIAPGWTGTFGPITAMLEFDFAFGNIDPTTTARAAGQGDYDVKAWGVVAYVEADLGVVRPFIGLMYGSGDDDPNDTDLEGFAPCNGTCSTGLTGGNFDFLTVSFVAERDVQPPARAPLVDRNGTPRTTAAGVPVVSPRFMSGGTNPFNDGIGRVQHNGVTTPYSNPGTLLIPVGLRFSPLQGHNATFYYAYKAVIDEELVRASYRNLADPRSTTDIDDTGVYHELGLLWGWTINRIFDMRFFGGMAIPIGASKDVAKQVFNCGDGTQQCEGEDIALRGEVRFRTRF